MAITIRQDDLDALELLPPGRYPCTISNAKPRVSAAGNECATVVFHVAGGEYDGRTILYDLIFVQR